MNKYTLSIYNHSGLPLVEQEVGSPFLPRVGEVITLKKELDNTTRFIVTEVSYVETSSATFTPYVQR